MSTIRRIAAYVVLTGVYGFTYVVALLSDIIPRRRWKPTGRIMVTGTFHNPGWYLSHVTPLTRSGVDEVILVVDEPQLPLEKVRFACPPKWMARLLSRAGAKAIWMVIAGIRYRPDLYMGYHLTPGACSALVAGKLLLRPSCYQMTAGHVEVMGGGYGAIESTAVALGGPSQFIETMALKVARRFELVVVRGKRARGFLEEHGLRETVAIITGSVNGSPDPAPNDRGIHLVFVGRLTPIKQTEQFIDIVGGVAGAIPDVRAAIVGEGPEMEALKSKVEQMGLTGNVEFLGKREDVKSILRGSKIFVLTSQSEGLSIAMVEAMAAGAVPVVADVGELGDVVISGVNGCLVEPNCIEKYTQEVMSLLQDPDLLARYSQKAIEAARAHCDIAVISQKWRENLQTVISRASGH